MGKILDDVCIYINWRGNRTAVELGGFNQNVGLSDNLTDLQPFSSDWAEIDFLKPSVFA